MMHLTIDGIDTLVKEGTTILDAAAQAGVEIPTLCRHEDLHPTGACGMCVVEVGDPAARKRS